MKRLVRLTQKLGAIETPHRCILGVFGWFAQVTRVDLSVCAGSLAAEVLEFSSQVSQSIQLEMKECAVFDLCFSFFAIESRKLLTAHWTSC